MTNMNTEQPPWIEVTVNSWEKLIEELHSIELIPNVEEAGGHRRSPFFYRGMADASWPLKTSLERLGSPPGVERPALRAFGKYAPVGTFSRQSEWECLAVAQHNGLPTRVLDWTYSPLIAAHFATAEPQHKNVDGVVMSLHIADYSPWDVGIYGHAEAIRELAPQYGKPVIAVPVGSEQGGTRRALEWIKNAAVFDDIRAAFRALSALAPKGMEEQK